jgi:hypothetical protein
MEKYSKVLNSFKLSKQQYRTDSKTRKVITIYTVNFKLILTFNAKTWTLTKRTKSKIQAMDTTFLKNTDKMIRWNLTFVEAVRRESTKMIWPHKKNGQNKIQEGC